MESKSVYSTDHAESVLSTHRWRTLANSCAYVIPHLEPGMKILDVGCGPGSITVDLAKHVPDGSVTGIETKADPLEDARRLEKAEGVTNVEFEIGDALQLKYEDDTFDLVHVHQVLQHVADPVKVLSEMRRVVKKSGLVACRESAGTHVWYPETEGLKMARDLQHRMSSGMGGNPNPGSHIHVWARQAGFEREKITCSTGSWCFSSPEEREYWGGNHAARVESSGSAKNAIDRGFATREQLAQIGAAWRAWIKDEDAWYGLLHGEIICRK